MCQCIQCLMLEEPRHHCASTVMKWGLAVVFCSPVFLSPSRGSYFCSFSYRCHLPVFPSVMAFTGGDGTKDCTLCISREAMEGNAAGLGRARIDFLSEAAERCVQLRAPGETCPAAYLSLALTSQCGVGKIREGLQKAKCLLLLLPSHLQATLLPTLLLNCNNEKRNTKKNPLDKWLYAFQNYVC